MFKNQLQELAQRSCFNLPSYACVREGPDHAPRFKASVNFNGEVFEGPTYSTTLRQAEHAAAEVALNSLSARGPSKSLTARVLDETGVYKNLLQESAHRAGLKLPVYTTVRSGPGHVPVFTSTVELAGMSFSGEAAKTKKQAEKNAAIAAWSALKQAPILEQQQEMVKGGGRWSNSSSNGAGGRGRVIRRRDHHHHQPRPRIQRPNQRDNNFNPTSFAHKRPPPPSLEREIEREKESCPPHNHKHNSFLSLLPPPPPRTASKILPPKLIGTPSQLTVEESPSSSEERQRDDQDNEWIKKISEAIKKRPTITTSLSSSSSSSSSSLIYGGQFGVAVPLMKIPSSTCHNQMAQRFAPAVQIRSVIPVCASPPVRPAPNQSQPLKEAAAPSSSDLASSLGKLKL